MIKRWLVSAILAWRTRNHCRWCLHHKGNHYTDIDGRSNCLAFNPVKVDNDFQCDCTRRF